MPLKKASSPDAFKANLKAEMAAGKPQKQALAIAYRVQRDAKRKKMAKGGRVGYAPGGAMPYGAPRPAQGGASGGLIHSAVPGRTDRIPLSPKGGSYIIPSFAVSAIGQGNTAAGAQGLNKLFGTSGPYGLPGGKPPAMPKTPRPGKGFAEGGETDTAPVDIMAAGGEYVVDPAVVANIGGGDLDRGTKILDAFVEKTRKTAIRTLRKLPKPRKK
jgi:hypothetical protein